MVESGGNNLGFTGMPGGFGGFGGGGFGAFGLVGLVGLDSLGRRRDGDEGGCANARFLALENGIAQTQDMITNQNVMGLIANQAEIAAVRFDAIQNNINQNQTQALLATERTNANIAEVKFQEALNLQATSRQISDCCCSTKMAIESDGDRTRALITQNLIQDLRDKNGALTLELSQCKQNELFTALAHKIDRNKDSVDNALINFGTILNSKTNTNGIQA